MNQASLNTIVHQLGAGHVTGFFVVLARVSPLFIIAPLFSSRMLPVRVRATVAVALAIGLTGIATHGQHIPGQPLPVASVLIENFLVGLAFAFAVGCVFYAVEAAGAFADAASGFSYGSMINPINGSQGGALTNLYALLGTTIFIAIGGDAWVLHGLARTFELVPVTRGPRLTSLVGGAEHAFGSIFTSALEVAAPVMLALVITDVAFGMVSRVVPQLNVFAVGFPFKVGVALLVVSASLPFLGGWMTDQLETSVGAALHTLRIA
jgi:flagellar biosynthesis protein FliR